jgi:hypothetical protein
VKDGKGDLLADSHSVLNRWKNHFCQLLNLRGFKAIWQTEIHTADTLVPKPSAVQVDMTTQTAEKYKSPYIIQSRDHGICSEIHEFINSIWKPPAV